MLLRERIKISAFQMWNRIVPYIKDRNSGRQEEQGGMKQEFINVSGGPLIEHRSRYPIKC